MLYKEMYIKCRKVNNTTHAYRKLTVASERGKKLQIISIGPEEIPEGMIVEYYDLVNSVDELFTTKDAKMIKILLGIKEEGKYKYEEWEW